MEKQQHAKSYTLKLWKGTDLWRVLITRNFSVSFSFGAERGVYDGTIKR